MIDPKLLRQDFEGIKALLKTRGLPENINDWQKLDEKRRTLQQEFDEIRSNKNKLVLTIILTFISLLVLGVQLLPYVYGGSTGLFHSHGKCSWPNSCN